MRTRNIPPQRLTLPPQGISILCLYVLPDRSTHVRREPGSLSTLWFSESLSKQRIGLSPLL